MPSSLIRNLAPDGILQTLTGPLSICRLLSLGEVGKPRRFRSEGGGSPDVHHSHTPLIETKPSRNSRCLLFLRRIPMTNPVLSNAFRDSGRAVRQPGPSSGVQARRAGSRPPSLPHGFSSTPLRWGGERRRPGLFRKVAGWEVRHVGGGSIEWHRCESLIPRHNWRKTIQEGALACPTI